MAQETNDATYWRAFDSNDITHSAAHYLMAIDTLRESQGYARVTDVAEMLSISRGAASLAISQLKKRGWVEEDPHRFLLLSRRGARMAAQVKHNFRILSRFFEEVLAVTPDVALADACKMEHLVSTETKRRLVWLMRYILSDPERAAVVHEAMKCFKPGCELTDDCPLSDANVARRTACTRRPPARNHGLNHRKGN